MNPVAKKRIKLMILLLFVMGMLIFFYRVRHILTPFLFAFIITYLFDPLVNYFEKKNVPRWIAIIGIYAVAGGIIFVFSYYLFPIIFKEMQKLAGDLPHYFEVIQNYADTFIKEYHDTPIPVEVRNSLESSFETVQNRFLNIIKNLGNSFLTFIEYLVHLVLAPILAFYFLKDSERIKKSMRKLVPVNYRAEVVGVIEEINGGVHGFIRGQLLDNAIIGGLIALGLFALGMHYALLIGIMVAIMNLIPFLGPIVGAVAAVALSLLQSPWLAIKVLILHLIVEQLDGSIINPKIVGDQTHLHPVLIIFALFVGADFAGILGMLLAVPVVVTIKVLLRYGFEKLKS